MPDAAYYFSLSDPDKNPAYRGWSRAPMPRDAATLDRMADAELAVGRYHSADRLSWLAAGLREQTQ